MRFLAPLAGLILLSFASAFAAEPLPLALAERLAVERDAERARLELEAAAQSERAVAAGSLPDPELRLGAANLPVDSFALDAEPMTQLVIGIRQMFPPGDTRALRRARGDFMAEALEAMSAARAREVRRVLREAWLQARTATLMQQRIATVRDAVAPLAAAAESRYATGGGRQGEYLGALLRLDRLEDRALQAREREAIARAALGRWLDEVPADLLHAEFPSPPEYGALHARLPEHPLLDVYRARIAAGETAEAIVEESFGPQWGLDFSYGRRDGLDMTGEDRPDFASAMVTLSLPLFTGNRQQRERAAASHETRAIEHARDNQLRELEARLDTAWRRHEEAGRQLALLGERLLPAARQARAAVNSAYAGNTLPFSALVDAELDLLELELRRLELEERRQVARAELDYLAGDSQ